MGEILKKSGTRGKKTIEGNNMGGKRGERGGGNEENKEGKKK